MNTSTETLEQLAVTLENALEQARQLVSRYESERVVVHDAAIEISRPPRSRRQRRGGASKKAR